MNAASKQIAILALAVVLVTSRPATAQYQTIGPASCGLGQSNCHTKEDSWWQNDAHRSTVDLFYDDLPSYEKIAELAGVGAENMFKGDQLCMKCHGTVVSGRESREVDEGVSCESCHGPGSGYKDPHSEGDPALGVERPGYVKALELGLLELKNREVRAETCVRCHYITDQKLLAAGHPDGARFNYVSGIRKVAKHWKRQPDDSDLSKSPFSAAMQARGPVAKIAAAAAPAEPPPAKPVVAESKPAPPPSQPVTATPSVAKQAAPAPARSQPRRAVRPARTATTPEPAPEPEAAEQPPVAPLDLPPFPQVSDTMSVEQILVLIKERLELLYEKTRGR